jgi:hypothetical protein
MLLFVIFGTSFLLADGLRDDLLLLEVMFSYKKKARKKGKRKRK